MSAIDSSSLKFWEWFADFGTWLVIIGVAGEGIEIVLKILQHKLKNKKFPAWYRQHEFFIEVWGAFFWFLVVVGLAIEFNGNHKAKIITDSENVRLTQNAAELNLKAETFRLKADQLEQQINDAANKIAANDPANRPISKGQISAFVWFPVSQHNFAEKKDSSLQLCDKDGNRILFLMADDYTITQESLAKIDFHIPLYGRENMSLAQKKTGAAIDEIWLLKMTLNFLPPTNRFFGGFAQISINGKSKMFWFGRTSPSEELKKVDEAPLELIATNDPSLN